MVRKDFMQKVRNISADLKIGNKVMITEFYYGDYGLQKLDFWGLVPNSDYNKIVSFVGDLISDVYYSKIGWFSVHIPRYTEVYNTDFCNDENYDPFFVMNLLQKNFDINHKVAFYNTNNEISLGVTLDIRVSHYGDLDTVNCQRVSLVPCKGTYLKARPDSGIEKFSRYFYWRIGKNFGFPKYFIKRRKVNGLESNFGTLSRSKFGSLKLN
ncbi:hypothetical protein HY212_02760 [Candidatus Pacearchaeota archaeon]|nr:hypothetical protein [Candidatus Pacearchaeota archaeon]